MLMNGYSGLDIAFKTNNASSVKTRIESCIGDICRWMNCNNLKLNQDKSEIVLISSKFRNGPSFDYVNIRNERIPFSVQATSLGVVLDKKCPLTIAYSRKTSLQIVSLAS